MGRQPHGERRMGKEREEGKGKEGKRERKWCEAKENCRKQGFLNQILNFGGLLYPRHIRRVSAGPYYTVPRQISLQSAYIPLYITTHKHAKMTAVGNFGGSCIHSPRPILDKFGMLK